MNTDELKKLAENAKVFSDAYVRVKEELVRAGVQEGEAIASARIAALWAAHKDPDTWLDSL